MRKKLAYEIRIPITELQKLPPKRETRLENYTSNRARRKATFF